MSSPMQSSTWQPDMEYRQRLGERRAAQAREERRERILGNARVAYFLPTAAIAYIVFSIESQPYLPLAVIVALFFILLAMHQRVIRAYLRARRAGDYYQRGLDRLANLWPGVGEAGDRFLLEDHPFAADLDLFGNGSLFQRISMARTTRGERTLAEWLLAPATPETLLERQEAIRELRGNLDLLEQMFLLGSAVPLGVDFESVSLWGAATRERIAPGNRMIAFLLGIGSLGSLIWWLAYAGLSIPFCILVIAEGFFAAVHHKWVKDTIEAVERRAPDLLLLSGMLRTMEQQEFQAPRLQRLKASLEAGRRPPSQQLATLVSLLDWLNSRRNIYFAPFGALLLWTTQLAFAIESWRVRVGPAIERWLAAVGELEALLSLATFSYENPDDPFPEIASGAAAFVGDELGHPLIPKSTCVRNDIRLDENLQVLLVSGSNMSGKSTLLRTVGINAVLAMAGGTVRAKRLRLVPVAIGATLRIEDSLQAGRSRFYAEITRIRQIVDLTHQALPVLFLFDEIFHGTNSNDRRQGAEGVIRTLVERKALGLLTTHDLALVTIADQLAPRVVNVHFADELDEGKLRFDYKMRPGVVQRSNAIALMRAVGLEV